MDIALRGYARTVRANTLRFTDDKGARVRRESTQGRFSPTREKPENQTCTIISAMAPASHREASIGKGKGTSYKGDGSRPRAPQLVAWRCHTLDGYAQGHGKGRQHPPLLRGRRAEQAHHQPPPHCRPRVARAPRTSREEACTGYDSSLLM